MPRLEHEVAGVAANPFVLMRLMTLANFEGRVSDALVCVETLRATLSPQVCSWQCLNVMIDTLIMAGRYHEALTLPDAWSLEAREHGARRDSDWFILARVNAAEALENLGRMPEAVALVSKLEADCDAGSPARGGVCMQAAWIATLVGEPARALTLLEAVRLMPAEYRAELHYTRALALSALGRHDDACREAQRGFCSAVRASSFRNGLYILGSIAHHAGDHAQAARHFEAGFEHPYRAQGGAALVCFGDTLQVLGRIDQAKHLYEAVAERDPQSHARDQAAEKLLQLSNTARMR
jgi:tetratricopeptide (TPR) repeat protein